MHLGTDQHVGIKLKKRGLKHELMGLYTYYIIVVLGVCHSVHITNMALSRGLIPYRYSTSATSSMSISLYTYHSPIKDGFRAIPACVALVL